MTPAIPASSIRFGRVTLLPAQRRVLLDDEPVRVGSRAFDLLNALVARRGQILPKQELLDLVWSGMVVEENNLQVQICALRKLLGPQAILTVPGRGYAFSPGVEVKESPAVPPINIRNAARRAATAPLRGRSTEVAALRQLVQSHRLVTVAGPGGIGKSRLVQGALGGGFTAPEAVAADLASLSPGAPVATIASLVTRPLGLNFAKPPSARQFASALAGASMTLVLENAEHVLDGTSELADAVLERAADVRVVCTSRAPLKSRGEQVLRLGPLALPAGDDASAARDNPALLLLLDTISALQPRDGFTNAELHDAVTICRHLDGVPLAIELAGSRVPLLGIAAVRRHLTQRFRLLATDARGAVPRHRSLRASMEWSWTLLGPREQDALAAISRYPGRFTLGMARQAFGPLAANEWDAMELLGVLVDASMMLAESGSRAEFRLFESTRLFAQEKGVHPDRLGACASSASIPACRPPGSV
jgi:predicted ATPase/DNA-binding winged helix-turn-helix (wHTH) protein